MLWGVISVHVYSNVILSSKCGNAVAAQLLCLDCPEGLRMLWRAASRLLRTEDAGERESSYIPGRYLIYPWGSNFPKSHYQQPHYNGIRRGSRLICIQLVDLFFSYLIGWPLNPLLLQITKIGLILSSENKSGIFTSALNTKNYPLRPSLAFQSIACGIGRSVSYNVFFPKWVDIASTVNWGWICTEEQKAWMEEENKWGKKHSRVSEQRGLWQPWSGWAGCKSGMGMKLCKAMGKERLNL